jgi:transposase
MQSITTIGLDIAKSVFQVHGVDAAGQVVLRRQLRRRQVLAFFQKLPPCLVGIEACASSHHWSRELQELGHTVRLMPPAYVKPYVKRQKNDATDAEAICEAVTRPNMRFVPTKTAEQQSCLILHRAPAPQQEPHKRACACPTKTAARALPQRQIRSLPRTFVRRTLRRFGLAPSVFPRLLDGAVRLEGEIKRRLSGRRRSWHGKGFDLRQENVRAEVRGGTLVWDLLPASLPGRYRVPHFLGHPSF